MRFKPKYFKIPPPILSSFLITNKFAFWINKIHELRYQIPSELRYQMIQLHQVGKEDSPACLGPGLFTSVHHSPGKCS